MRALDSATYNSICGPGTTLCTLWRVTLASGDVRGFTDNSRDETYNGVTYAAATGFMPSAIQASADAAPDNLSVDGILSSPSITEDDLMAGVWDYATVEILLYDYVAGLLVGVLTKGKIGPVEIDGQRYKASLLGLSDRLRQNLGELTQPKCRAELGDDRCKVDLPAITIAAVVSTVTDRRTFSVVLGSPSYASGHFDAGKVSFTSGDNSGYEMEIRTTSGTSSLSVSLQLPMPNDIAIGNTLTLAPGCLKRLVEDCKTKYNNVVNFRGEPYVPGVDQLTRF